MVFAAIFNVLKTSALIIILNDYLQRKFPEKYGEILINVSLHSIKLYSHCQIYFIKLQNYIKSVTEKHEGLKIIANQIALFMNKSEKQNSISEINESGEIYMKYFTDILDVGFEPNDKNLFVFSDNKNANNSYVNHVILRSQPFSTEYEVSNIKFLMSELKIGENSYKIDLKTNNDNYYIVNNILDKKFFDYFLYVQQICKINDVNYREVDNFILKIIDQNANLKEFEISEKKYIEVKKDDYNYIEN
jgi:hypothetical protein